MSNNNSLQDKIAELTAKHEHEEYTNNLFPDYKTLAILHGNKKRIVVQQADKAAFIDIISKLPPTNKTQEINSASGKERTLSTPFKINIENPCTTSQWTRHEVHISYISNNIEVEIELPIENIKNYITSGTRNITDSEYHYFPGYGLEKLKRMQVLAYSFIAEQMSWYGGNKTLLNENAINDIIAFLSTNNQESDINKNNTEA